MKLQDLSIEFNQVLVLQKQIYLEETPDWLIFWTTSPITQGAC